MRNLSALLAVLAMLVGFTSCGHEGTRAVTNSIVPAAVTLTAITVSATNASMTAGATQQLTVTGTFSDGSKQTLTSGLTWTSSTASIATVSSTGSVTAVAAGSVTITASQGTISGNTALTVTAAAAPSFAIASLSASSVTAYSRVTVTGTGFDPTNSAMSVLLTSATGIPVAVSVFNATSTTADFIAPALVDSGTGGFLSGAVDVSLVQASSTSIANSNVLSGALTISAPAAVPAGVPPGAVSRAFLTAGLNALSSTQAAAASNASVTAALNSMSSDLTALGPILDGIISNPSAPVSVTTTSASGGAPLVLDAATLGAMDQMLVAYLQQFQNIKAGSAQLATGATTPVTTCSAATGSSSIDTLICAMQSYHQSLNTSTASAAQAGANADIGFYLGFLSAAYADGLSSAGAKGVTSSKAAQYLWILASPYLTTYFTAPTPPPLSAPLAQLGANMLDTLAKYGVPVSASALTAFNAYAAIAATVSNTGATSPQGGILPAAPPISSGQSVFGFLTGSTTASVFGVPSAGSSSTTTAATQTPPAVSVFDGAYTGSYTGTDSGSVVFTVSNGSLTLTVPLPGTGTLDATGKVILGFAGANCTFGGRFTSLSGGHVTAGGDWVCTGSSAGSGTWVAAK